jgi:integrase
MSIGRYGPLTPQQARKKARKILGNASEIDPLGERDKARHEPTFRYLAEEYIKRHANKKRSGKEDERIIHKDLLPRWGSRKSAEIGREDVSKRMAAICDRGAPIAANRTLALIRKMFNFAYAQGIVSGENPTRGVDPPGEEHEKDRFLTEHEIKTLWERLPRTDASPHVQLALKLILVTAQRPGEVLEAEWKELDFKTGWWTIPAERSKNGLAHRVPLATLAQSLLGELDTRTRFLFPSPRDENEPIQVNALGHAVRRNLEIIGIEKFTPHDLRRTAASHMTRAGVSRLVLSKVLNHVEHGITAVYDRHGYDQEKVNALTTWNDHLRIIIDAETAQVVSFRRKS